MSTAGNAFVYRSYDFVFRPEKCSIRSETGRMRGGSLRNGSCSSDVTGIFVNLRLFDTRTMTMKHVRLCLTVFACAAGCAFPAGLYADVIFRHIDIDSGLAHSDANCLVQDSTGIVWIGTYAGIQSYDGYVLHTYDYYPEEQKSIRESHNRILSMTCDGSHIWVGSESGLTCFELDTRRYVRWTMDSSDPVGDHVCSSPVDYASFFPEDSLIFVRTSSGSLFARVSGTGLRQFVWDVEADRQYCRYLVSPVYFQGRIWGSLGHGVVSLKVADGRIHVAGYRRARDFGGNDIQWIESMGDSLYVRTDRGCALVLVDDGGYRIAGSFSFNDVDPDVPEATTGRMAVDGAGSLWCSWSGGVFKVTAPFSAEAAVVRYFQDVRIDGISARRVRDLMVDDYGNIWIASISRGVYYRPYADSPFHNVGSSLFKDFGFAQNEIVAVTGGGIDTGTIWMIVENASVFRYEISSGKLSMEPVNPGGNVRNLYYQSLELGHDGRSLYIGTNAGIIIYDVVSEKSRWLDAGDSRIATSIAYMEETDAGQLAVATWGMGMFIVDSPLDSPVLSVHLSEYTEPSILSDKVSHVKVRGNSIYLCTTEGLNVVRFTDDLRIKDVSSYRADPSVSGSMSSNYMVGMDFADDSTLYIGTIGGGLNRVTLHSSKDNDYSAISYTVRDGLVNNDCETVLVDRSGDVWLGGAGIARIDPETGIVYPYGYSDGLSGNVYKMNVAYRDADGKLFMGGLDGLDWFSPEKTASRDGYRGLLLTSLYVNDAEVAPLEAETGRKPLIERTLDRTSGIRLDYRQNDFSIGFAAVGFDISDRVMYRFRLSGHDREWQVLGDGGNRAFFSNLPYGTYRFEVQTSMDKGYTWNEPGRSLGIRITPPWWLTTVAKTVYVVIILTIIIVLLKYYDHEKELKKENEIQKILIAQDEEKYEAKMQFFMNASHELKTPLTLILLSAESHEESCGRSRAIATIIRNARKMLSLIGELVDIRKTDLGISSLSLSRVNVSELVRGLYEEMEVWAENRHIRMYYESGQNDIIMDADREKFGKMVMNLLTNAIKYTGEDGSIRVSLKRGRKGEVSPAFNNTYSEGMASDDSEACILTVRDTGIGISPESIRHIYERFFQVLGSTPAHLGSGIGLAIVKSVVQQHGGEITVSSERGVGTEFIVVIPIREECPETVSGEFDVRGFIDNQYSEYDPEIIDNAEHASREGADMRTMLIVEDNLELAHLLAEHFSDRYDVVLAGDGKDGLEKVTEVWPDIIISDVMMPYMDGIEMCRRIKENLSLASIPLILLTARADMDSHIEGYGSGADLYMPKPFPMKLLDVNVRRLVRNSEHMLRHGRDGVQTLRQESGDTAESRQSPMDKAREEAVNGLTARLKTVIDSNLADPELSPDFLARELGISRTRLYRDLKRIDGMSLSDYIRNARLDKAAYLLVNSAMNVAEIMDACGFVNSSHFTKIFKMKFDVPPTGYRKSV